MKVVISVVILLILCPSFILGNISGRVLSELDSTSLTGASIYLTGSSIGTVSDQNGEFFLSGISAGEYEINFEYVGYARKSLTIHVPLDDPYLVVYLNQEIVSGPIVSVVATMVTNPGAPVTYSELDKAELEKQYTIQDVPEILSDLPSTTFYSDNGNGLGYNYLSIRGFGQRRISVMINGIPQNDPEDHNVYWIDFPDFMPNVQRIQVQRGAGSAFYGPPAIGGSINIVSNYFSPKRYLRAESGYGSFNTRKYAFALNSGLLKDRYVFYSRFSRMESEGYRDQAWIDFWSYFFGAAVYNKTSNLRLHFYGGPIEDGLAYFGLPKMYNSNDDKRKLNLSYWAFATEKDSVIYDQTRRKDEIEHFNQPHLELLYEQRLTKSLKMNNNFFFIQGKGYFDYNGNWASLAYYRLTPEFGYNVQNIPEDALVRAFVNNRQIGWLPNIVWEDSDGQLILGGEFRYHRSLHWGRLQKASGLPEQVVGDGARRYYQYKGGKEILSLYVHRIQRLSPSTTLQADLQYAHKQYRLFDEKFLNNDFKMPYHFINPRFGINYHLGKGINSYINVSRTTREPRLKNLYDAAEASTTSWEGSLKRPQFELDENGRYDFTKPLVKPETLTDIELGAGFTTSLLKSYVNVFYMLFNDEIIKKGKLDRFGQPITGNAEKTLHKGVELLLNAQLQPEFALNANVMFSKNTLESYSVFEGGDEIKLNGNPIAGFPEVLANIRLTWTRNNLYVSPIIKYVGKQYTDNFKNETNTLDAYTVVNISFRYHFEQFGLDNLVLQGRINNLLDRKYLAYGNGIEYFPAATRNAFLSIQYELN